MRVPEYCKLLTIEIKMALLRLDFVMANVWICFGEEEHRFDSFETVQRVVVIRDLYDSLLLCALFPQSKG